MYDELTAFIGLIIYELDEILYKASLLDDYLFENKRTQISNIQYKLRYIQISLEKNELSNLNLVDKWVDEYKEHTVTLPYGHCFVAKCICDRYNLDKLKVFFEYLGHYLNNNIYFRE
jgi:hypothetical protein